MNNLMNNYKYVYHITMQPESYDNIFFCGGHFEHTIARGFVLDLFSEIFVENFTQKRGTKNCTHQCWYMIHKTLYYLILFFVGFLLIFVYIYETFGPEIQILDCPGFWTTRITYSACPHNKNPFVSWSPITCLSKHMNLKQVRKKQKDLRQQKARHK